MSERTFKSKKKPANWKPRTRSPFRRGICCGAWSRRAGRGCLNPPERGSLRCRQHGSRNTGPASLQGKARVAEAQRTLWRTFRAQYGLPPYWYSAANRVHSGKRARLPLRAREYLERFGPYDPTRPQDFPTIEQLLEADG